MKGTVTAFQYSLETQKKSLGILLRIAIQGQDIVAKKLTTQSEWMQSTLMKQLIGKSKLKRAHKNLKIEMTFYSEISIPVFLDIGA